MAGTWSALIVAAVTAGEPAEGPPRREFTLDVSDLETMKGLVEAVNAPAFSDRPVVQVEGGRMTFQVRFRPYQFVDARGGVLEVAVPSGWPAVDANLARCEAQEVAVRVQIAGVRPSPSRGRSGAHQRTGRARPTAARQCGARGASILDSETVADLAGRLDGLGLLLGNPRGWIEYPPSVRDDAIEFRLRPLVIAEEGLYRWSIDWKDAPNDPLSAAGRLRRGEAVTLTQAVTPTGATRPAFWVARTLSALPDGPIGADRGVRISLGHETLAEAESLAKLPGQADLLWDASYARPLEIDRDGRLHLALAGYAFRDIRGEALTPRSPAEG
jgi:hypothetical protein